MYVAKKKCVTEPLLSHRKREERAGPPHAWQTQTLNTGSSITGSTTDRLAHPASFPSLKNKHVSRKKYLTYFIVL